MMISKRLVSATAVLFSGLAGIACGGSISYTGVLGTPQDTLDATFTLGASGNVTFRTWGFGGGTNAAGSAIAPGGFDPLIALFTGPLATASIVTDALANPLADADNLVNFPWSFVGNCPLAGTVAIGRNNDCGDDLMQVALAAGTYTLVLSDANYIPNAVFDNGALSEGFTDFTGGVFQTCDPVSNACITPNGNYALDIVSTALAAAPEPSGVAMLSAGLAALAGWKQFRSRRRTPHTKGAAQ